MSGTSCLACDSPCLKCSSGGLNSCFECHQTKGLYLKGTSCVLCDSRCLECSGPGVTNTCSRCNQKKAVYLDGTSCLACDPLCLECSGPGPDSCFLCDETKGVYLNGTSCLPCNHICKTCSGESASRCLSCSKFGYFAREGICLICTEATEADKNSLNECPPSTQIEVDEEIEELVRNFTIVLTPAFKAQMEEKELETAVVTAEGLLSTYLYVRFQGAGGESPLTVLEKRLDHSGPSKTTLFVSFLEKLRFGKNEYIKISVKKGLILRTGREGSSREAKTVSES